LLHFFLPERGLLVLINLQVKEPVEWLIILYQILASFWVKRWLIFGIDENLIGIDAEPVGLVPRSSARFPGSPNNPI
jgi:hypothetical protein